MKISRRKYCRQRHVPPHFDKDSHESIAFAQDNEKSNFKKSFQVLRLFVAVQGQDQSKEQDFDVGTIVARGSPSPIITESPKFVLILKQLNLINQYTELPNQASVRFVTIVWRFDFNQISEEEEKIMRRLILLCLFTMQLAVFTLPGAPSFADTVAPTISNNSAATYKAIFHVDADSPKGFSKVLKNINNVLEDPRLKGHLEIELMANSGGYKIFAKGNGLEEQLRSLKEKGVLLVQCENTLKELKVKKTDIYDFVSYTPSGMGELILRQADSWAYVHATL